MSISEQSRPISGESIPQFTSLEAVCQFAFDQHPDFVRYDNTGSYLSFLPKHQNSNEYYFISYEWELPHKGEINLNESRLEVVRVDPSAADEVSRRVTTYSQEQEKIVKKTYIIGSTQYFALRKGTLVESNDTSLDFLASVIINGTPFHNEHWFGSRPAQVFERPPVAIPIPTREPKVEVRSQVSRIGKFAREALEVFQRHRQTKS